MRGRHSFGHGFDLQVLFFPRGLPHICPSPLVLGLGSGLCPLATCSKQSFSATSVAKGSLGQLSEVCYIILVCDLYGIHWMTQTDLNQPR